MNGKKVICLFSIALFFFLIFPAPEVQAGNIDSTFRYAWSENLGWIDFGTSSGNVEVADSSLSGYAWGENTGWISLNCSNTNSCASVDYKISNSNGALRGYAWGENVGWIHFNPNGGGVSIESDGDFTGHAWGENVGWLIFNCAATDSCGSVNYKVNTSWRPPSTIPVIVESGTAGLALVQEEFPTPEEKIKGLPPAPTGEFVLLINNGVEVTKNSTVELFLRTGSEIARIALSNFPDFRDVKNLLSFRNVREWDLCAGLRPLCVREETYTVYAKLFTKEGRSSPLLSASIYWGEEGASVEEAHESTVSFRSPEMLEVFTRDLLPGDEGPDVRALQQFLNSEQYTIAAEGAGSPRNETDYFGALTAQALSEFQTKQEELHDIRVNERGALDLTTRTILNKIQSEDMDQ